MEPQGTGAAAHETARKKRKIRTPDEIVDRYQTRIVKAQQAGKLGKVKHLQGMLAHSQSARIVAVERVTENDGRKTPGVDGQT